MNLERGSTTRPVQAFAATAFSPSQTVEEEWVLPCVDALNLSALTCEMSKCQHRKARPVTRRGRDSEKERVMSQFFGSFRSQALVSDRAPTAA